MPKTIHLICNAHLDPIWQWEWEEGAAEALSTFRIAADFCDEFDDFVFCHNEALLYEWIEEYDPDLFSKIQKLVKLGKWHIMGGWYIQPDCNMPSGEGFVRQIFQGRKYFAKKFGVMPTVGVNVDPFGHSRGLVQIMNKFSYNGYLFMRPSNEYIELPNEFKWVGYDDSEITAIKLKYGYGSAKGKVDEKIKLFVDECNDNDFDMCLWGVGNHGGGPSKIDLDKITKLTEELKEEGVILHHSTPEEYFSLVDKKRDLKKINTSLNPWSPGCYTSQVRIKQKYRSAENEYFLTENMCTRAYESGLMNYPENELESALKDILLVQFHDVLPGTTIKDGEESALRTLDHSLEILSKLRARAFFALASGQRKAPSDKIPFFAYNSYPYPISSDFAVEFNLWDQVWDFVYMNPIVYDKKGNICPSQCEKERSSIPLEWRKRVVFHATLEPMKMNRFECAFETTDKKPTGKIEENQNYFTVKNDTFCILINKNTGLIDKYEKNGVNFLNKNSLALEVFDDNFDPWYMERTAWKDKVGEFKLLDEKNTAEYIHTSENLAPVHIIECGNVRTVVEACFGYNKSRATVKYIISEDGTFKVDVDMLWLEKQRLVKLNVSSSLINAECIGEHAYGREILKDKFEENVSQKYIIVYDDKNAVSVSNKGTYGSSYDDGELKITLLRSPSHCAHPVGERQVVPQDRLMPYVDIGERCFSFRFDFGDRNDILNIVPRKSLEFNVEPVILSFYPTGTGNKPADSFEIINSDTIQMTALKKSYKSESVIIRLYNPTDEIQHATIKFGECLFDLSFSKFEIKTVEFSDGVFEEVPLDGELS